MKGKRRKGNEGDREGREKRGAREGGGEGKCDVRRRKVITLGARQPTSSYFCTSANCTGSSKSKATNYVGPDIDTVWIQPSQEFLP